MKPHRFQTVILFCAALLISAPHLHAAESAAENAGAESTHFEESTKLENQAWEFTVLSSLEKTEEETEKEIAAAPVEPAKFELRGVRVTGAESIPADELEALASGLLHRKVSFEELLALASRIEQHYRRKGFVSVYAYLPRQEVLSGVVEIRVLEGEIGSITIEQNKWFSEKAIRRRLHLKPGATVRYQKLLTAVNQFNEHRDVKAQAVLAPGEEFKTTDVALRIKDRFPFHISSDAANLGTENTGRTRWGIGAAHTNLSGRMDEFSTRFQWGQGSRAVGTDYRIPVGPWDTEWGLGYSHTSVEVGGAFKALDIEGRADVYGINLIQPVKHTDFLDMLLNAGFDFKSIRNTQQGRVTGKDEFRILSTGLDFKEKDRRGRTYFPLSFHFGFSGFLGASDRVEPAASRAGTGGQFFVYRSSLIRYTHLPLGMTLLSRASWQLTPDKLAASEQFRLGGAFSVRGYEEGSYLADYGGLLTHEILIPAYFFPEDWKLPYSKLPLRRQIQGVAFFDFGAGRLHGPTLGDEATNPFLAGAGGGLRIHLFDRVFARLQWGSRIGEKVSEGPDSAFYYGISAELL